MAQQGKVIQAQSLLGLRDALEVTVTTCILTFSVAFTHTYTFTITHTPPADLLKVALDSAPEGECFVF